MSRITEKTSFLWNKAWATQELGKAETERRMAVHAMGLVGALRHGQLTVDEAGKDFFNFKNYRQLKQRGLDQRLLRMFEWAMELPNIEPLGGQALAESYAAIEGLAESVLTKHMKMLKSSRTKAAVPRNAPRAGRVARPRG